MKRELTEKLVYNAFQLSAGELVLVLTGTVVLASALSYALLREVR